LMEFWVSAPAFARPTTLAFEDCACSKAEEKSDVLIGTRTPPSTCPPFALITGSHLLEIVAKGVVGGNEEPRIVPRFNHGASGTMGECIIVVGVVDRDRRAGLRWCNRHGAAEGSAPRLPCAAKSLSGFVKKTQMARRDFSRRVPDVCDGRTVDRHADTRG